MDRDYNGIAERKNIRYSEDVYFLHYDKEFELWLNYEKIASFDSIRDFNKYLFEKYLKKDLIKDLKRVYVYTIYFNELYDVFKPIGDEIALKVINRKMDGTIVSFQIFGGITYKEVKYYLGTDKIDGIDPKNYCELIEKYHSGLAKHSFTTSLKSILLTDEMLNFGNNIRLPKSVMNELYTYASLAPIIYSDINKEFTNVYCYDFDSAYISKYFTYRYPVDFCPCINSNDPDAALIRLRIKKIKAKNLRFCWLSLADRSRGTNIFFMNRSSKRVVMADEIIITVFWFELEMIDAYYTYDEMIREKAWTANMERLPQSFRDIVLETYKVKEMSKRNSVPYEDKKVLLNRIHGFFITSKDYEDGKEQIYSYVPMQIGFYTIAMQRYLMFKLIQEIGLENIVSAHTDSIKTKGNYNAIVDKWNEEHKNQFSDTLGKLEFEGIMEKVVYFSNTRAKYIMNGEFKIKHGGIWCKDAEDILDTYTYDTFNKDSVYNHTVLKVFGAKGDENFLDRIQEKRVFSEVNDYDE